MTPRAPTSLNLLAHLDPAGSPESESLPDEVGDLLARARQLQVMLATVSAGDFSACRALAVEVGIVAFLADRAKRALGEHLEQLLVAELIPEGLGPAERAVFVERALAMRGDGSRRG